MKTKTKRRICEWISGLSAFLALGVGGNVECGFTPLGRGSAIMSLLIAISALSAYKAGWMK